MKRLQDFPAWTEAARRLGELRAELTKVETDIDALLSAQRQPRGRPDLDAEAARLLSGDDASLSLSADALAGELRQLRHRREVVKRAVEMQEHEIRDLRRRLSKEIIEPILPAYREAVREIAQAAAVLARAVAAERALREPLADDGVVLGDLRPMPMLVDYFDTSREHAGLMTWLNEAVEHGLLSRADVEALDLPRPPAAEPEQPRAAPRPAKREQRQLSQEERKAIAGRFGLPWGSIAPWGWGKE